MTYFGRMTVLELWGRETHLSDITESTVPGRWNTGQFKVNKSPNNTVKILKIGTPYIITVIVLQME